MAPANSGMPVAFGGRFGRNRNVSSGGNPDAAGGAPNTGGAATPATSAPSQEVLTPEQQIIMIEANRLYTQDAVTKGEMPPLPPTDLTPPDATGIDGRPLVSGPPPVPGE
jgi:hypothetical protein